MRGKLVVLAGLLVLISAAGCVSDYGGESPCQRPDPATHPRELLPEPPEGWRVTGTDDLEAEMTGADLGAGAHYVGPDGSNYSLTVLRWPSERRAKKAQELYRGGSMDMWLVNGVFMFLVDYERDGPGYHGNASNAEELLTYSEALNEACVEESAKVNPG